MQKVQQTRGPCNAASYTERPNQHEVDALMAEADAHERHERARHASEGNAHERALVEELTGLWARERALTRELASLLALEDEGGMDG